MTLPILGLVLLISGLLGMAGAQGLRCLDRRPAVWLSTALSITYLVLLLWQPVVPWLTNLMVVVAGASVGFLFGGLLGSVGSVLAFLTTAAVVDLVSFSGGLTARILEAYRAGGSKLLRYLAVFVELGGRPYAVIGVTDIAILAAAYLGLSRATGREWAPGAWLLLGLASAFLVGVVFGGAPGLPFLAGAAWLFYLIHRPPQRAPDSRA